MHFVYTKCVFEWEPRKARVNAAQHGISFEDAVTVFLDPEALDGPDLQHSFGGVAVPAAWSIRRWTRAHGRVHIQERWRC